MSNVPIGTWFFSTHPEVYCTNPFSCLFRFCQCRRKRSSIFPCPVEITTIFTTCSRYHRFVFSFELLKACNFASSAEFGVTATLGKGPPGVPLLFSIKTSRVPNWLFHFLQSAKTAQWITLRVTTSLIYIRKLSLLKPPIYIDIGDFEVLSKSNNMIPVHHRSWPYRSGWFAFLIQLQPFSSCQNTDCIGVLHPSAENFRGRASVAWPLWRRSSLPLNYFFQVMQNYIPDSRTLARFEWTSSCTEKANQYLMIRQVGSNSVACPDVHNRGTQDHCNFSLHRHTEPYKHVQAVHYQMEHREPICLLLFETFYPVPGHFSNWCNPFFLLGT